MKKKRVENRQERGEVKEKDEGQKHIKEGELKKRRKNIVGKGNNMKRRKGTRRKSKGKMVEMIN